MEQIMAEANKNYYNAYEELMDLIYDFAQKSTYNMHKQPMQAIDLLALQEIANKIDEVIRLGYLAQGVREAYEPYYELKNKLNSLKEKSVPRWPPHDQRSLLEALSFQ